MTFDVTDTITPETAQYLEDNPDVTLAYHDRGGDRVAYVLEERDDE